jgi:hypothetical protein
MIKLAIQWRDEADVVVAREFDEAVAARQVLLGYATFVAPNVDSAAALERARDLEAKRLSERARDRRDAHRPDWLRSNSKLEVIQMLGHAATRGRKHGE